ncbi:O-antigen polymerase [Acinetobacter junii]|uniref:O-antigen polymerase n=1 Tax=Acinetobacter junii TaxID=40215 RepID=UPI003A86E522
MKNWLGYLDSKVLVFLLIPLSLVIVIIGIFAEFYATTQFIAIMASFLMVIILLSNMVLGKNTLVNPLVIFSLMYSGYVFGAFYYAFSAGDYGKFLSYLNLNIFEVERYFFYALSYAIICFVFFVLGFSVFYRNKDVTFSVELNKNYFFLDLYKPVCLLLISVGLLYWVWMSYTLAGGIVPMLFYFQAFRHLIEDAQLSTLPYHLYYAGIFLWLIASVVKYNKVSFFFIFFSFLGLVIGLSTGRITLAFTYLMSQMIFYYFCLPNKRKKIMIMLFALMCSGFIVYFLRILSNQYFMGVDLDLSDKNYLGTIIGDGNITDLQQLVIVFKTFDSSNMLLGESYLDSFRNTIGAQFGLEPHSIGLLIKELYIPSTSGAPTPGAIGEAYANFLFLGPAVIFCVGGFFSYIYMKVLDSNSPIIIMVYSIFLARFVFMYPKVDSTMMVNFLWGAIPLILVWYLLRLTFCLIKK